MFNQFDDEMKYLTDEELIRIINFEKDNFHPDAIESAKNEIKNRQINTDVLENINYQIANRFINFQKFELLKAKTIVRSINHIVDSVSLFLIMFIFIIFFEIILNSPNHLFNYIFSMLLSYFGYFIFLEFRFQKTFGKWLTRTKVINIDGKKSSLNQIFKRTFFRLIPFDAISFLAFKDGFHDKFSNTIVIYDEN